MLLWVAAVVVLAAAWLYTCDWAYCVFDRDRGKEWCLYRGTVYEVPVTYVPAPKSRFTHWYMRPDTSIVMELVRFRIWWLMAGLFALGPGSVCCARLYRKWRTARRRRAGLCVTCAYDLRGLTSPRCPECGSPFDS